MDSMFNITLDLCAYRNFLAFLPPKRLSVNHHLFINYRSLKKSSKYVVIFTSVPFFITYLPASLL